MHCSEKRLAHILHNHTLESVGTVLARDSIESMGGGLVKVLP